MERESFLFYRSFYEAIIDLPKDIKLEILTAIIEYALDGREPESLKPFARGMFTLIKPNLDANISKYKNGKKGGRKPEEPGPAPARTGPQPNACATFEEEIQQLKSQQIWLDSACKQLGLDHAEILRRLDAFATHCNVERPGEIHPTLSEARRHFLSWMRTVNKPTQNPSPKPKPRSNDYSYQGGFGGKDI